MTDLGSNYTLKILSVTVDQPSNLAQLSVNYQGMRAPGTVVQPLESVDLAGLMKGCEAIAQRIFHDEWRLNNAVELTFTLADENGLALWHTHPTLYLKCPLTMSMKWSCLHLSDIFKTMTTLGIIELPDRSPLDGTSIDADKTAKVIMDAMANGVEFMGNIMLMRGDIDHDSAKRGVAPVNLHQ
ncbi:hypothetical protein KUG47_02665 [Falsochrobactrum sp. TDYN1]|uniref:Uncharacterized protein n=1 Tax=Falsochrobactrum tianjinense TaxID=2706015 RepID=A0A949PKW8_9HYPH|nr:hypothetical protein [Falsochrobactrum sp. TDYN1]MBV2142398.1 hypothetical protein [Falsochrobactrum sp. TDYN1]